MNRLTTEMKFTEYLPGKIYRPVVKSYWQLEGNTPGKWERIVPGGCAEILFNLGDPFFIRSQSGWITVDDIFIGGQITGYVDLYLQGSVRLFALRFFPTTAHQVLQVKMDELNDDFTPLIALLPGHILPQRGELAELTCDLNRIKLIENYLEKLLSGYDPQKQQRVSACINALEKNGGQFSKKYLAQELGVSPRRVEQIFTGSIGLRPKLYWRIKRLQRILAVIKKGTYQNFTDLAYQFDYFDQAHFNRDFKNLTGLSPRSYAQAKPFMSSKFSDPAGLSLAL